MFIREEEYSTNCHYAIRVVCFAEKMWGDILSPGRTDDTFWALFDITEFQNIYFDPHILVLLGVARYVSCINIINFLISKTI